MYITPIRLLRKLKFCSFPFAVSVFSPGPNAVFEAIQASASAKLKV